MDNIFKSAIRRKLRFATTVGNLGVEQLWDLSLEQLNTLAVALDADLKEAPSKTFIPGQKTEKNTELELKFNIVVDILKTKHKEQEAGKKAYATRQKNERILTLIQDKKDEELKNMSVDELEALLEDN